MQMNMQGSPITLHSFKSCKGRHCKEARGLSKWSSYQYYIGKKKVPGWLRIDFILGYFDKKRATAKRRYHNFVHSLENQEYGSPLKEAVASTILGGFEFVNEIKQKYLNGRDADRNLPALTELLRISITEINEEAKKVFKEDLMHS